MKQLNKLFLVIFSALMVFTPFFSLKRVFIMLFCFVVWFFTSCSLDKSFFKKATPFLVLLVLWGILSSFLQNPELANAGSMYFTRYIAFSLWTYIWCVFYVFYSDNTYLLKGVIKILVLILAISCALTIRGNILYPDASRLLAGLGEDDTSLGLQLRSLYVGGYDIVYGIVYLVMPTVLYLKFSHEKKVFLWIFLLLEFGVILLGDFFTGFLLAIAMIIFSCVRVGNSNKMLFAIFSLVLLFVVLEDFLFEVIIGVGNFMGLNSLAHRATQMMLGTYQSDYDLKLNDLSRIERAVNALRNIWDSPIVGQLFVRNTPLRESGHSEILTYFEKFGLFAFTYVIFYIKFFKRCLHKIYNPILKKYFVLYVWFVVAFLFLDTFDIANATGFVVFFFAPILFQLLDDDVVENKHIDYK